jgi:ABC-type glycerol-3-phosphate transport system substrate-binding protein
MKLTPFKIVIIAIFSIAALAGLYFFATFTGFGGKKDQVGIVSIWGTLPKEAIGHTLEDISAADSSYAKVTYTEIPEASFDTKLADALASGTGPDAVILSQENLMAESAKLRLIPFSSLPKRTYLDSYLPEFELFLTGEGTYGVPLALDPLVLYWNRGILGSAGVVSAPTTWEAVTGLAPTITKSAAGGAITRSLIPLGGYRNVPNARATLSALMLQAGTSITQTTDQGISAVFGDQSSSQFGSTPAESAVSFYAQFADPAKTVYSWNPSLPTAESDFVAGDLALLPGYASERSFLAASNPNLDFDMAPLPAPASLTNRFTYGRAYVIAITKVSANPGGAYFAALALSGKGKETAEALGMAPARRSDLAPSASDTFEPVFYPEALSAKGWLSPAPGDTDAIFSAMIDNVITGRKNVEQAVLTAASAITAALH